MAALSLEREVLHASDRLLQILRGELRDASAKGSTSLSVTSIQELEDEFRATLHTVHTIHNDLLPINRFPDDFLVRVFVELTRHDPLDFRWHYNSLLAAVSVCRHWREVALRSPQVWSRLFIGGRRSVRTLKLFWERSEQALIELHVHKPTKEGLRWLKRNAREIVPRLRGLRVGDCHGSVDPHCLFAFSAPHLERLVYTHLVGQEIPDNLPLFAGDTPKLRKLILCQYEVWPSQSMCNLTHLYLSNQHSSLQLDVAEFSEVLRRCPDLEELYIVEAGPSVGAELNGQSVRLPRLRRLALHTKSPILEHFVVSCFVLVDPITIVFSESTIPSLSGVEESELDQHKSAVSSFIGRFNFKRVFLSTNPNDYNRRITLTSKTSAMTFQWSDYDRRKEIFTQLFRLASWGHVEEFHFEVGSKLHDILPHPLSEFISTTQAISFLSIIPRKYADNLTHFIPLIRNPKLTHLAILLPFQTDAIRHFQEDWWVALKTALKEKSLEGSPLSVLSLKYASGFFSGHDFLRRASPTTQLVEDDSLWEMEMPEVSKKDVHPTWGDYRQFAVVDSDIWLPF